MLNTNDVVAVVVVDAVVSLLTSQRVVWTVFWLALSDRQSVFQFCFIVSTNRTWRNLISIDLFVVCLLAYYAIPRSFLTCFLFVCLLLHSKIIFDLLFCLLSSPFQDLISVEKNRRQMIIEEKICSDEMEIVLKFCNKPPVRNLAASNLIQGSFRCDVYFWLSVGLRPY